MAMSPLYDPAADPSIDDDSYPPEDWARVDSEDEQDRREELENGC